MSQDTMIETTLPIETLIAERRAKRQKVADAGHISYPNQWTVPNSIVSIQKQFQYATQESLISEPVVVQTAGRIILKREMGKAYFFTLLSEEKLQVYIANKNLAPEEYALIEYADIGDIWGFAGELFLTKTGELTIRVRKLQLLAKSLRPLPDKHHGLQDQEMCYRQRYLDLISNPSSRHTFIQRSKVIQTIRHIMEQEEFLEVETPMMHPIAGGAAARPFITHHNTLDLTMYLRIAPELYLKRLIVGGVNRVFEINRNFRNEGMSVRHNPEFTMMEFYAAFTDYQWMMDFTEKLIRDTVYHSCNKYIVNYQGQDIDFGSPFIRLTIVEAIIEHSLYTEEQLNDLSFVQDELKKINVDINSPVFLHAKLSGYQLALFEEIAEPHLKQPTFIKDYPVEVSPLARSSDSQPHITERFELFIAGRELANGFSELNDPEEQYKRFQLQTSQKEAGDIEAMEIDEDYVHALEYGMPPTSGCGIGIDRLVMLITNAKSIRDVILFPLLRPHQNTK